MVLLSFDTEEFDVPREHGVDFSLQQGMEVSVTGTHRILDVLKENEVKATFFCTGNFVNNAPDTIRRIIDEGHELACHGVERMFPVSDDDIAKAGYLYNSSLNPAFIPGRYMHLTDPRTCFMKGDVVQIPASVTPLLRFPLFWLALHNLPESLYHRMVRRVLKHDGYFVTYFHPWEFYELKEHPEMKMPFIIKNHSGLQMVQRLDRLVKMLKKHGYEFGTYTPFAIEQKKRLSK